MPAVMSLVLASNFNRREFSELIKSESNYENKII